MHQAHVVAAGTPLGDPIEVGALAAALGSQHSKHSQPLRLMSNKACYGHTEGAAGLSGLLLAAGALGSQSAAPIMHLRACNPHVALALAEVAQGCVVPVQPSGGPATPLWHMTGVLLDCGDTLVD